MLGTLVAKDLRQHGAMMALLTLGFCAVFLLGVGMKLSGPYAISALEVVRFSLLTIVPLLAFIIGGRIIVGEYLDKTRLFVEALPISRAMLVSEKFWFGWLFLITMSFLSILLAVLISDDGDALDARYICIITLKSATVVTLIWSVVFCFSLAGFLRLFLYSGLAAFLLFLVQYPGIDQQLLAPFALMDANIFSYERQIIPWNEILQTCLVALFFIFWGYVLALLGDGSVAETLAKPLMRRDFVILGIACVAAIGLFGALSEKWKREPYFFSGDSVLRHTDPAISVLYLKPDFRESAEHLMDQLVSSIAKLQDELNIATLPNVRVALKPGLNSSDIGFESSDGVLVKADFSQADQHANLHLNTVTLHQIFQSLTSHRSGFEPIHWILDGFSRWWVINNVVSPQPKDQLLAHVIYVTAKLVGDTNLSDNWQVLSEKIKYRSTELLALSAIVYLEETYGRQLVIDLAREFLIEPVSIHALVSLRNLLHPVDERFRNIVGISLDVFFKDWQNWLQLQGERSSVKAFIEQIPQMDADVRVVVDEGIHRFSITLTNKGNRSIPENAQCWFSHTRVYPFDVEWLLERDDREELDCDAETEQWVTGPYTAGDRVYYVVELATDSNESSVLRLHSNRINLQ